jgi:hypothetical protein
MGEWRGVEGQGKIGKEEEGWFLLVEYGVSPIDY